MPSHATKRSWTSEVVCLPTRSTPRLYAASRFRIAFADINGSNQAAQSGRSRMAICRSCRHEDDEALTKNPPSAARRKPHGNDFVRGRVTALYQRNQLPTAPDQKGHDQKDKEARCEQFATGMRGWRKVKTIIRFARPANTRLDALSVRKARGAKASMAARAIGAVSIAQFPFSKSADDHRQRPVPRSNADATVWLPNDVTAPSSPSLLLPANLLIFSTRLDEVTKLRPRVAALRLI